MKRQICWVSLFSIHSAAATIFKTFTRRTFSSSIFHPKIWYKANEIKKVLSMPRWSGRLPKGDSNLAGNTRFPKQI